MWVVPRIGTLRVGRWGGGASVQHRHRDLSTNHPSLSLALVTIMASSAPSKETLTLLDRIAQLSDGLKNGSPGSREGLLAACGSLISELSHPTETMLQTFWAQPSHHSILRVAVDIKLLQALNTFPGSGASAADIAAKCDKQVDASLVGRMLRHLAAMGTIREVGPDTFAATATSKAFAEPGYEDTILYLTDNFQPVHQEMPSYFKENGYKSPSSSIDGPFQHAKKCKGSHYFEYFQQSDPEMGRRFASMMDVWSRGRPRWFFEDWYPVNDRLIIGADSISPFLVDVGGGSGHDVEGLRQAFPKLPGKLVLQDRPEVIQIAKLGPGVEGMAHDFMTEQLVKGARAYFLHSIIQDWNDDVNTEILKAIVPAMRGGYSKILVNDFVVPNQGAHWAQSKLISCRANERPVLTFSSVSGLGTHGQSRSSTSYRRGTQEII